jgi:HD-GYP domain-containing protein (c-di-GMP phosphodiesterase class II)
MEKTKINSLSNNKDSSLSSIKKHSKDRDECRKISLRVKISILLSAALFVFGISSAMMSYNIYMETSVEQHKKLGEGIAKIVADSIDPYSVKKYLEQGESADGYLDTKRRLMSIKNSIKDIKYIYVYKILKDGCHVVFDLDADALEGDSPGTVIPFDKAFEKYIPSLLAGDTIAPIITDETYGWLLTAYEPVYDTDGVCQCYAAADISMDEIRIQAKDYLRKLIVIFFCIFAVILIICIWLSNSKLIIPINTMATATSKFAYNTKEAMERSLDWIRNINITTGDEVENLYKSFVKMASDSVKYIKDIKHKNEAIAIMHNALIITLADMVESRDKNTGQHIRKTAAYTKIIMEELKREGVYQDELTDDFIENVVNSAPLHDIGKINVPDAILNKPGKLTTDEFELMKTHTTTGGKIISHIIEIIPDSEYLYEAKNLATYHHEKWNGAGYPAGLSGKDIPLSARIMAVADVFDALVSNRSYKKGFPYEKALAIIREESGTHFDPKIVDAFFAAKESILDVAKRFNKMDEEPK